MVDARTLLEARQINWNPFATKNEDAIRASKSHSDVRPAYSRDGDKILHSWSFTRYLGKTQVFFTSTFDMMSSRIIHVQIVSKVGRHIGRVLGFNQDLIESIALGHDIGHPPYGHVGEEILSKISAARGIGYFWHNYQSIRWLHDIESHNLTLQTLDGILCHNGESRSFEVTMFPQKTFQEMKGEMSAIGATNSKEVLNNIRPMTPEGCIVRLCDIIGYIGRDIEDAILLKVIRRDEIPEDISSVLGSSNRQIINSLVTDLIQSFIDDYPEIIAAGIDQKKYTPREDELLRFRFSPGIRQSISNLMSFNYKHIYLHTKFVEQNEIIKPRIETVYNHYLADFKQQKQDSEIFTDHIKFTEEYLAGRNKTTRYGQDEPPELIVRDFIAGMTERYFEALYDKIQAQNKS